jgi:sigma-E factor negative regulatory protein RseC
MTDAPGTITALDGNYAIVLMEEAGCGRCHEEGGCGGNNLGKMLCGSPRTFRVLNQGNSAIGDRVTIVIAEGAVRRSATLAYGLPLLTLFVGTLTGSALAGETGAIVGAIVGLTSAWLALHYAQIRGTPDSRYQPYIK